VSNNWLSDLPKSRYPNNTVSTSNDDPPDLQRHIIETLRKIKEIYELRSYFAPGGLNVGLPTNLCFSDWGTPLGFKGYVCKKCISFEIVPIFDDVKRTSVKSRHACNPQKLYEAQFVTDIPGTIHKRRQELISCLTLIVNYIAEQQELVDLTAVEIPASVFDSRLYSYEEYVDLDSLQSVTLDWAYAAAKEGKTMINKIDLTEFLDIFEATLGFFRLTIDGVKRYFFVYITKGLEPRDIKYLKKLFGVDTYMTTDTGITMNNLDDRKIQDMVQFIGNERIPVLRLNRFSLLFPILPTFDPFFLPIPATFQASNIPKNELDEVRERQECAFNKSRERRSD